MSDLEPNEFFRTLYKRGSKGEIREWSMELHTDGDFGAHRVASGVRDGAVSYSGWTVCTPKNVGKKNETTGAIQARDELERNYAIKLERGYFKNIEEIDNVPFTKPMLAVEWSKVRGNLDVYSGVYTQPKLDGIRCIARADGLWSRTGKPILGCPHIFEALQPYFDEDPDLILDGELYNPELRDDFNTITSVVRKAKPSEEDLALSAELIQYHVYDCPSEDGTFAERIMKIWKLFDNPKSYSIFCVETKYAVDFRELDEHYARWIGEGYEGQMIRLNANYERKRSKNLIKRKEFITSEFPVLRVEEGLGNWSGCVKRFIVALPDGRECGAGVRGTQASLKELLESGDVPEWATVRYFTPTPDGVPRFPVVIDWGLDSRKD